MARTEKYFVGPQLLADIRRTITRVDGTPYQTQGPTIPFIYHDLARPTGAAIRMCTFTGSWEKGAQKTVTFRGVTATPNTVAALNVFAFVPAPSGLNPTGSPRTVSNCAIARDGTAWYLIAAEC